MASRERLSAPRTCWPSRKARTHSSCWRTNASARNRNVRSRAGLEPRENKPGHAAAASRTLTHISHKLRQFQRAADRRAAQTNRSRAAGPVPRHRPSDICRRRSAGGAGGLRRSHLARPLQGLRSCPGRPVADRGLGLPHLSAARHLLRAGPRLGAVRGRARRVARPTVRGLDRRGTGRPARSRHAGGQRGPQPRVPARANAAAGYSGSVRL